MNRIVLIGGNNDGKVLDINGNPESIALPYHKGDKPKYPVFENDCSCYFKEIYTKRSIVCNGIYIDYYASASLTDLQSIQFMIDNHRAN